MNYNHSLTGFLLRFEIARTTLEIAGTKNSGGTAILARNARSGLVNFLHTSLDPHNQLI